MSTGTTASSGSKSSSSRTPTGDHRLLSAAIRVGIAFADALVEPALLNSVEHDAIVAALRQIETEYEQGDFDSTGKDIFRAIQQRLDGIAGNGGVAKFNAAQGRNEQIVTTLRVWLLEEMVNLGEIIAELQRALVHQAESHVATLMPGYIDLQPAQVVSCSQWLLSYFWMMTRDQERLTAVIGRTSVSPLGSGTLAGTPYRIDRRALAQDIGLGEILQNSMDAVSDLDFAAEFLFFAAMIGIHLSRLTEDLLLYNNPTFGFLSIDVRYLTASPQSDDQNSTIEANRHKTGRLLGNMAGFVSTLKGLPSVYSQDSANSQEVLFEAIDLLRAMLTTLQSVVATMTIHPDRMYEALEERILAGDLVDYLVGRDTSYQEARQIVQVLIEKADQTNIPISEMDMDDLQTISAAFDTDVFTIFDYSRSAAQRATIGGIAPAAIRAQIRQTFTWLTEAGLE